MSAATDEAPEAGTVPGVPVAELLPEEVVRSILDEIWVSLVGEEEFLVPVWDEAPSGEVVAGVEVSGGWRGAVSLRCDRSTAEDLTRCLLRGRLPGEPDAEDVEDALGELANVVGGGLKALLPGPSSLGLPTVDAAAPGGPTGGAPADAVVVVSRWRDQPVVVTVVGAP